MVWDLSSLDTMGGPNGARLLSVLKAMLTAKGFIERAAHLTSHALYPEEQRGCMAQLEDILSKMLVKCEPTPNLHSSVNQLFSSLFAEEGLPTSVVFVTSDIVPFVDAAIACGEAGIPTCTFHGAVDRDALALMNFWTDEAATVS